MSEIENIEDVDSKIVLLKEEIQKLKIELDVARIKIETNQKLSDSKFNNLEQLVFDLANTIK